MFGRSRSLLRRLSAAVLVAAMAGGMLWIGQSQAGASETTTTTAGEVTIMAGCSRHPGVPDWFYPALRRAAETPNDGVPTRWGVNDEPRRAMMKIVCMESSFRVEAYNPAGYYGLGQLGRPAIDASRVRFSCYWEYNACDRTRRYYQLLAALRYANQRYGSPQAAWSFWQSHNWW
ncbi:MAG: hypothetical protein ACRDT6_23170 [Micromonosporaceae bacterium]